MFFVLSPKFIVLAQEEAIEYPWAICYWINAEQKFTLWWMALPSLKCVITLCREKNYTEGQKVPGCSSSADTPTIWVFYDHLPRQSSPFHSSVPSFIPMLSMFWMIIRLTENCFLEPLWLNSWKRTVEGTSLKHKKHEVSNLKWGL